MFFFPLVRVRISFEKRKSKGPRPPSDLIRINASIIIIAPIVRVVKTDIASTGSDERCRWVMRYRDKAEKASFPHESVNYNMVFVCLRGSRESFRSSLNRRDGCVRVRVCVFIIIYHYKGISDRQNNKDRTRDTIYYRCYLYRMSSFVLCCSGICRRYLLQSMSFRVRV